MGEWFIHMVVWKDSYTDELIWDISPDEKFLKIEVWLFNES